MLPPFFNVLPAELQPALICMQFADSAGNIAAGALIQTSTLFVYIFRTYLLFSERFLIKVKDCVMSQARVNIYVSFFESVTCPLLFQLCKVSTSFLHYAKADKLPHAKPKESANLNEYCMRL
jgi:hypothetical protein